MQMSYLPILLLHHPALSSYWQPALITPSQIGFFPGLQDVRSVNGRTTLLHYIASRLCAMVPPMSLLSKEIPHAKLLYTSLAVSSLLKAFAQYLCWYILSQVSLFEPEEWPAWIGMCSQQEYSLSTEALAIPNPTLKYCYKGSSRLENAFRRACNHRVCGLSSLRNGAGEQGDQWAGCSVCQHCAEGAVNHASCFETGLSTGWNQCQSHAEDWQLSARYGWGPRCKPLMQ